MGDSYHFRLGNFHCVAINDGDFVGNAELLFANAPVGELDQVLNRYGLIPDHLLSTWTCLIVNTETNKVLIDTGVGSGEKYGGQLLPTLRAEGISPNEIDTVILTHGHADHIGGCVTADGKLVFPNATYYMWRDEWDFWTAESSLEKVSPWAAGFARRKLPPLAPRLETIDKETDIIPGIRALPTPGHTVGHMALEILSQNEHLIYMADTALHPVHIEYPDWYARVDQSPEQTIATRRALYKRAVDLKALVLAFHFPPFPSLGHIITNGLTWEWQPIQRSSKDLDR